MPVQKPPINATSSNNLGGDYSIYRTCIEQVMQGSERLPSLPAITLKIRNALANDNITHQQLAKLVTSDPSLCLLIMRCVSSPIYLTREHPKSIEDAIRLLGMDGLDRIVMLHSLKSLFVFQNRELRRLFDITWKRQTLKACIAEYLAKKLGYTAPDEVLIASLLSEAGTLAILSALAHADEIPDEATYLALGREYSKSIGLIILKKWNMGNQYSNIISNSGAWTSNTSAAFKPIALDDLINLALYHGVALFGANHKLPVLNSLDIYKKLPSSLNACDKKGLLKMITEHIPEITQASKILS